MFDLEQALSSIVSLQIRVPDDALTAGVLGTERAGHGVLIDTSGLIVTIGYLVTEAQTVWIIANDGQAVPGHVVGYDQETGLGLVQALQRLNISPLPIGSSAELTVGESVMVAGHGGAESMVEAKVIAKQEFAGYWEYLLDEAIFTAPAHPNWGGAAVIGDDGTLRGIGSLMVQDAATEKSSGGNMIVPIDLLEPILDDLVRFGRVSRPPRPWLGMMTTEVKGALVVVGLTEQGPAAQADIQVGDVVLEIATEPVDDLAEMLRHIWRLGPAGTEVPIKVMRNGETLMHAINSVSRYDYLKSPDLH